jgi:sugar (pentulose or hexulose) kinase
MAAAQRYLAFDLGAESGRAMGANFDGSRLGLEELHRFPTGPVRVLDSIHWDVLRFWSEMQIGLGKAASQYGDSLASLGVDTWGVDFGLLAADDTLLGNPYHYRDARTNHAIEDACRIVPRSQIYAQTGIQFMQFNTLYQLLAMVQAGSPALKAARRLLTMPDLFNFWLSGVKANEFTNATTTQCYDPRRDTWAVDLLERLNIPSGLFQEVTRPCSVLGMLRPAVAEEARSRALPVVAVGSHDTASAVAAVPAEGKDFIYISSGTWSLMGVENSEALINEESMAYDFTNEGGVNHTVRFLKNVMGMLLLQECRREWARAGQSYTYDEITALAEQAAPLRSLLLPSDPRFFPPGPMVGRIQAFCQETGQPVPHTHAEVARCILESLAMEYRWLKESLEYLNGRMLPVIHIIGGGSRNRLLNQFTAEATGCRVVAGPVEATAVGNVLAQMAALGHISSLAEGRALVRASFDVSSYEAKNRAPWEGAYQRYLVFKK